MRRRIIAGNWKMNNTVSESLELVNALKELKSTDFSCEVLVCPPFTALYPVIESLKGTDIVVGAQNMHYEEKGAFTGEISPKMLKELGCKYVILGHSERRTIFAETNELINKKIKAAFQYEITPILCVGEPLEVRENNNQVEYVNAQLRASLNNIIKENIENMVIAYEPIWAIGTGKTATPEEAEIICQEIREEISRMYDDATAKKVRIQYGGSVKASNAKDILTKANIDGALVGGAALKAKEFLSIIEA